MGWWTDIAIKHPGTPNHGGRMYEQRGLVLHIAEGSYNGTIAWQMNPDSGVSSHFIVSKGGEITQMLDTDVIAWTQADGNGHWLSVENEGYTPDELTDAQVNACARILAKGAAVYGYPLLVAEAPWDYGLGHHSMGAENGVYWGHSACPGESIKQQKPLIVDCARGEDMSAEDVWTYDIDPSGNRYSAGGAAWTVYQRTDYLANDFAPDVIAAVNAAAAAADASSSATTEIASQMYQLGDRMDRLVTNLSVGGLAIIILMILIGIGTFVS